MVPRLQIQRRRARWPIRLKVSAMRQALENPILKFLVGLAFAIIILVFIVLFGPQSQGLGQSSSEWVAKVGNRTVDNTELQAAFERYRTRTNDRARLEDAEFLEVLRQQALTIAAIELLAQRAEDAGLSITDDELSCFIVNWHPGYAIEGERICARFPADYETRFQNYDYGFFTTEGQFDVEYYDETVRNRFSVSTADYESHKERELLARYYIAALEASVVVPNGLVRDVFERRNTTIDLEYIPLDPTAISDVEPAPDEVAAWAAANGAAIQAAYDDDTERWTVAREVQIRRVYIRKPAEDSPDYAEAEARYQDALRRVTDGGEAFDAVARELSEIEREAEEGGDMGTRTADTVSSDLWAATEGLEVGGVTGVEQDFAWNVITLEAETPAGTRTVDQVRDELALELATAELVEEARAELEMRGARVLELAATADSLEAAAAQEAEAATRSRNDALLASGVTQEEIDGREPIRPVQHRTTGAFAMERPSPFAAMIQAGAGVEFPPEPADEIPGIGASRDLVATAFALTDEAPLIDELVDVDGTLHLVRLIVRAAAPDEIPSEDLAAISGEIRTRISSATMGDENSRAGMWMNLPGPMPEFVTAIIEDANASGDVRLRSSFFVSSETPDPVDPVDEI